MKDEGEKKSALRLAHTADTPRGAAWMAEQLRELRKYGHAVEAIIPAEGELSQRLQALEVPYELHEFGFPWMICRTYACLRNIWGLIALFHRRRYHVVHHHLYPSMIVSRLAAWIADVPVRLSMIPGPFYMDAKISSNIEISCAWMDTHTIVSCQYSGERYRQCGMPDHQLKLVYYGADENVFNPDLIDRSRARHQLLEELGLDESAKLVGMVAYFYPSIPASDLYPESVWGKSIKGHETLLACVPIVLAAHPQARFLLIGDGWGAQGAELKESLERETQERGLGDHVYFLGHRPDVPQILAGLDVSLQLSRSENLGGTIEGLLMGTAMVATRIGGMVDSVRHEETGLLVEVDDSDGLASAITRLLCEPELASRLGTAGRRLMLEHFTLSETARRLDSIYMQSYQSLNHRGYRLYVSLFRAAAAIPIFAFIMAQQFRYELEDHYAERFPQKYRAIAKIQNSLCGTVRPLYQRNRLFKTFSIIIFADRLTPSLWLWFQYAYIWTKSNINWRQLVKTRLAHLRSAFDSWRADAHCKFNTWRAYWTFTLRQARSTFKFKLRRDGENTRLLAKKMIVLLKRVFDVALAAQLLIWLSPVMALALWNAIRRRYPAFERHIVLGKENRQIEILTFATLKNSEDLIERFYWLPLLFSVLTGDMSIVGPRIRPRLIPVDGEENLPRSWRLAPGLTGWCQLNMTDELSFSALNSLDILYMVNWNAVLDIKITLKTALVLIRMGRLPARKHYWMATGPSMSQSLQLTH